jgi:hypothetical protein
MTGIERLQSLKQKISKKKLDNLSKYVLYCIIFFSLYTVAEFVVSTITGINHDGLTEAVRFFCCGEAFLAAFIKVMKIRKSS